MNFRGPEAGGDRPQKPMVCPTPSIISALVLNESLPSLDPLLRLPGLPPPPSDPQNKGSNERRYCRHRSGRHAERTIACFNPVRPRSHDYSAQHGVRVIDRRRLSIDPRLPTRSVALAHHHHAAALHIDNRRGGVNVALELADDVSIALLHCPRRGVPQRLSLYIAIQVLQVPSSFVEILYLKSLRAY